MLSLRRSAANEPNDNASTQNQLERLKFEKDSEKDTGIKEKTYLEWKVIKEFLPLER